MYNKESGIVLICGEEPTPVSIPYDTLQHFTTLRMMMKDLPHGEDSIAVSFVPGEHMRILQRVYEQAFLAWKHRVDCQLPQTNSEPTETTVPGDETADVPCVGDLLSLLQSDNEETRLLRRWMREILERDCVEFDRLFNAADFLGAEFMQRLMGTVLGEYLLEFDPRMYAVVGGWRETPVSQQELEDFISKCYRDGIIKF